MECITNDGGGGVGKGVWLEALRSFEKVMVRDFYLLWVLSLLIS